MKFYLDNILFPTECFNGDITTTIKRDSELGGYLITNDAKLNLIGAAYDYVDSKLESSGYCGEIDIIIKDECNGRDIQIFVGKIFLLEIEKDSNCIVTTPLQDNNYYARISKNKSIKTFLDSTRSKNGATISDAAITPLTLFDPATGSNLSGIYQAWRVFDVFKNVTAFLSDGEMTFSSTLFGTGGEFEGLCITTGQELFFQGSGTAPAVSFADFYSEVRKKINTTIFIDATGNIPELRIESDPLTYTNNIIKKLSAVDRLTLKVDGSKLIAKVDVGSRDLDYTAPGPGGLSNVEANSYFTFRDEPYTTLGQCNTDNSLDLISNFILSSNIIEDVLMNSNNNFSDRIFFIDTASGVALKGNPFLNAPPYTYNRRLMNDQVLLRWNNALPNSIVKFSGNINNLFTAGFTSNIFGIIGPTIVPRFQFDNDYTDPFFDGGSGSGVYGNGTAAGTPVSQANSRYTCPNDGNYNFFANFRVRYTLTNFPTVLPTFTVVINKFNSGGTQIDFDTDGMFLFTSVNFGNVSLYSKVFPCVAGDYFECGYIFDNSYLTDILDIMGTGNQTVFRCLSAPFSEGEIFHNNNQLTIPVIKANFEYPIINADFYDIQENLFDKIAFTYNEKNQPQVQSGWIDTIKYNHNTSKAVITLRGTQTLIQ